MARLSHLAFGWLHRAIIGVATTMLPPSQTATRTRARLVVRLDEFGDAVLTTSLVARWAGTDPSSLFVVAPALWAPVYALVPGVRVFAMPTRSKRWRTFLAPIDAVRMGWKLRGIASIECAILPRSTDDPSWAILVAIVAGAARRVGFLEATTARRRVLNRGMDRALTDRVSRPRAQHELDDLAILLHGAGVSNEAPLEPSLSAPAGDAGAKLLATVGLDVRGARVAAVMPSAGNYPLKAWPIAQAAATWRRLEDAGFAPVLLGSTHDAPLATALANELHRPVPSLVGRTSVAELASVLSACALAVGADTGAMHLAAALGLPTIGLYGPTNAQQFALRGRRSVVLQELLSCSAIYNAEGPDRCRRCVYDVPRCMLALTPERVMTAVAAADVTAD
jgi:ADP-heptose:LPS heptosyltransferase